MAGGLLGVTVTMSLLSLMGSDTTLWLMRILMFLTGAGMAYSFLPVQAAAFSTISSSDTGRASALYNAQRQLGAAFGVAILSSVLNAVGPFKMGANNALIPNMTAYHAAFFAAAGLALIGSLIALTVIDKDAESTMKRVTRKGERDEGVGQVEGVEAGV
jgi:MFS family permease